MLMTFIVILLAELCTPEKASYWPKRRAINHWHHCTFEKTFAICNFFCGESGSSGTELLVLRCVSHGTFLTLLGAPGCPDWAAAGVHAVAPSHGQGALLVLVPQEAGFQADICRGSKQRWAEERATLHCLRLPACVRPSGTHTVIYYNLIDWNSFFFPSKALWWVFLLPKGLLAAHISLYLLLWQESFQC